MFFGHFSIDGKLVFILQNIKCGFVKIDKKIEKLRNVSVDSSPQNIRNMTFCVLTLDLFSAKL